MRITIAIPSHDNVPFLFAYDLAALAMTTAANLPEGVHMGVQGVSGTYIHKARQELIDEVVRHGADYVLFLDSDMRFPPDALIRLFNHKVPVVGINYAKRGFPSEFVALKRVGIGDAGERLRTTEDSEGLEEVEALGGGCLLIRTDVLADLPDPIEQPWFQNEYLGNGQWMGEDVYFCRLLREAGHRIFVDHDLSRDCSHIGQYEYDYTAPLASEEAFA